MNTNELVKTMEKLEEKFPRKKFPSYAKVSKDVWEALKRDPRVHVISYGNPQLQGMDVYVDYAFAPNTIKIYNLDNEEIPYEPTPL